MILKESNKNLRDLLKNFTQAEISKRSGMAPSNVNTWVKGNDIGLNSLEKIAYVFGYEIYTDVRIKISRYDKP